ncbi:MAG: hypothetical protein HC769_28030 [Cyanobacteria bacterium CRU_2_1]|nr:hypothetical protein [Cyanobacteria bacterium RU_5_0]NJR62329.1 hypothetical protein [Cyanobacteria bacterium CRU_2_1]
MTRPTFLTALAIGVATSVLLAVGASDPARAGDYTLTLDGSQISEQLEPSDEYLESDNSYFDTYSFQGRAGQQVTITMTSREVDAYLILLDPSGNSIAQDDDGAGNLDAQLVITLPVDGTYTVVANTYSGGTFGSYTLQASVAGSPQAINPPTLVPPSNSGGGTVSSLPRFYCDDSGNVPLTMAVSRRTGDVNPLIQWTSDWAAEYSPSERCNVVSDRLATVDSQFDRLILTAGTLNGESVVCAASNRDDAGRGVCASNGLIVTTPSSQDSIEFIQGLQSSFTRLVAGTAPDIVPATNLNTDSPYIDLSDF